MIHGGCLPVCLLLVSLGAPLAAETTGTPEPVQACARRLIAQLAGLPARDDRRLVVGQFTAFPRWLTHEYPQVIDRLHEATGQWPALLGLDYGATRHDPADDDLAETNRRAIAWWRAGGLVTVSWHARNPWSLGSAWDRTSADLATLLVPGPARERWLKDLDRIAAALLHLQEAGVVVLWRPFHEMNGGWFWWGGAGQAAFVAAWRHMHARFASKGLRNLVWVYAASSGAHRRIPVDVHYPGKAFCDLVGLDNYSDDVVWNGYEELVRTGKPFAATEFGPDQDSGRFDYTRLMRTIRERYPRTVYVLCWGSQWSLANNRNAAAFLADPWVITRDDWARTGYGQEAGR